MAPKTCITIHDYPQPLEEAAMYTYTVVIFELRIFTTLTSNPDVLATWINDVTKKTPHRYVGFEFELDIRTTRVSTLQLCVVDRCIVFQHDTKSPYPDSFIQFLLDNNFTFATCHLRAKMDVFRTYFPIDRAVKSVDLGESTPFLRDVKRKVMDSIVFGEVDSKWDRFPEKLTVAQVHYACIDAFLNLHLMFGPEKSSQTPA